MKNKGGGDITDLSRMDGEDFTSWKIRCCLAKKRKETDLDWVEIRDMLGLEITPDQLRKIAVGYEEYDNHLNSTVHVSERVLSISDLHIPFNLPLDTFSPYSNRVDTLVLNGDIQDCQSISSFPRKYRVDFVDEMIDTRGYMIDLINLIHPKRVLVIKGNHEQRLIRYLSDKLHEDLMSLMPDSPLELIVNEGFKNRNRMTGVTAQYMPIRDVFEEQGIEVIYTGDWWMKVGKVIFAHPLSYSSGMLKTTEKAVNFFLREDRDFSTIVLGHTHKLGSFIQGHISMYEQGCCCDLTKLDYADGKLTLPGQNGYIYMCLDNNGEPIKNKTKLIEI